MYGRSEQVKLILEEKVNNNFYCIIWQKVCNKQQSYGIKIKLIQICV